jgi:uncharacterized membrane protein YfcA
MIDPLDIALLGSLAFLGGLIFGLTGFGSSLVTIPLATHLVPLQFALALFALGDLVSSLRVGLENPKNAVRREWTRMVPMILIGTALGVTVLVNLPRNAGMILLGAFVFCFALYTLLSRRGTKIVAPAWAWLAGLGGGITSTLFGAGGPPYAIYLSQRGLTKEQFRATLGLATLTSITLRVIAFLITGLLLNPQVWLAALAVVPGAYLGIALARRLFLRISREQLMRAVTVMLLASGASLVWRAL